MSVTLCLGLAAPLLEKVRSEDWYFAKPHGGAIVILSASGRKTTETLVREQKVENI